MEVTLRRVVHSEWIKLRSLRSTTIVLTSTVVVLIGLGLLMSQLLGDDIGQPAGGDGPPMASSIDATGATLGGLMFAQLVIGVLGVLVISGEYSTGMIRSSLGAVTARLPILWGKTIVFGLVTIVLMSIATLIAFLGGSAVLAGQGVSISLGDPGVIRALAAAAGYLTGVGVLGIALGFLLRNTAAAITVLAGTIFLLPTLANLLLAGSVGDSVLPYLPSNAGQAMFTVTPNPELLSPLPGALVFLGYLVVSLGAAAYVLKRRDA